mmetsp:Transcript_76324/g.181496  ORF Transcript_76324/g.181496 Transcript_76324/m.181496 type:complete len:238 (+) Transcript_76324:689-1402(+)
MKDDAVTSCLDCLVYSTTICVASHSDQLRIQHSDSKLDGAQQRPFRICYDVPCCAKDEQISWPLVENQLHRSTRVRVPKNDRHWLLSSFSQLHQDKVVCLCTRGALLCSEALVPRDKRCHCFFRRDWWRLCRSDAIICRRLFEQGIQRRMLTKHLYAPCLDVDVGTLHTEFPFRNQIKDCRTGAHQSLYGVPDIQLRCYLHQFIERRIRVLHQSIPANRQQPLHQVQNSLIDERVLL